MPNHLRSGWIFPCYGSVGVARILALSGFARYMFNLLIVARVLNYEPGLPPDGSGLYGFELALPLLKAEPDFLPLCCCLWIVPDFFVNFLRYCPILVALRFAILKSAFLLDQIK